MHCAKWYLFSNPLTYGKKQLFLCVQKEGGALFINPYFTLGLDMEYGET